jgi:hypothetical protein
MNSSSTQYRQVDIKHDSRFENAKAAMARFKSEKKRGRIATYYDGSGNVSELEIVEKV